MSFRPFGFFGNRMGVPDDQPLMVYSYGVSPSTLTMKKASSTFVEPTQWRLPQEKQVGAVVSESQTQGYFIYLHPYELGLNNVCIVYGCD
jgi:hypothetical protein